MFRDKKKHTPVKRLVFLGLFISIALTLNYFERFIPIVIVLPGVKLGLANVVSLIALTLFTLPEVMAIVILRTVLSAAFYGSISAFLFSMAGGVFSLLGMWLLLKINLKNVSTVGISVFGSLCHNLGQLTVAVILLNSVAIYSYLPILLFSSAITGVIVGVVAEKTIPVLEKVYRSQA